MKMKNRMVLVFAIMISFLGLMGILMATGVKTAEAQELSYAAKFVCGGTGDAEVVKGYYATAVNIHNPQTVPVKFVKKAVIAYPERSPVRGPISPMQR